MKYTCNSITPLQSTNKDLSEHIHESLYSVTVNTAILSNEYTVRIIFTLSRTAYNRYIYLRMNVHITCQKQM